MEPCSFYGPSVKALKNAFNYAMSHTQEILKMIGEFSMTRTSFYFDHNATTPVAEIVKKTLPEFLELWGNPSSIHWAGRGPKSILRQARQNLAQSLSITPLEIIFTSGGSESNNTVIQSVFTKIQIEKNISRAEFITSTVEHPSVMKTMKMIADRGVKVHYVPVSRDGVLDMEFYKKVLNEKTALVSIMFANNETGTLFPIAELAELAHTHGALFHSDCVQAFGKVPLNLSELGVDFTSLSGHKFYALKGSGLLYVKRGCEITSLIYGGGQERQRRGGTENTLGIYSMGLMAKCHGSVPKLSENIKVLRDHMEQRILNEISDVRITANVSPRLPNTSSLVLDSVDGETLLMSLDMKGFAVSTGAACSSGNPEPSPVLLAMGLSRKEAQTSLRLSLGWGNTLEQVDLLVDTLKQVVERLRSFAGEDVTRNTAVHGELHV